MQNLSSNCNNNIIDIIKRLMKSENKFKLMFRNEYFFNQLHFEIDTVSRIWRRIQNGDCNFDIMDSTNFPFGFSIFFLLN